MSTGGGAALLESGGQPKLGSTIALAGLMGYLLFFGIGLSPGPWLMNTELYPMYARGRYNDLWSTFTRPMG